MIASSDAVRAFVGLGGNLGDPAAAMAAALQALDGLEDVEVIRVSSIYRTAPWGVVDQPDFLNAVAELRTGLTAMGLLECCLDVERQLKRVRKERWGPRLIDMDILLYGDSMIDQPGLQVPHPRMQERAFVLAPLAEIAPDIDVKGNSATERLSRLESEGVVRLPEDAGWWREKP